jgi:hypothetical protein
MAQMALLRRTGHVGILIMLAFAFASKGCGNISDRIDQIDSTEHKQLNGK